MQFFAFTEKRIECVLTTINNTLINVAFMYCPPHHSSLGNFQAFMLKLKDFVSFDKKIVLIGDFNKDYPCPMSDMLLHSFGFHQLINSVTTDYNSCLDHIYVNFTDSAGDLMCGTLESHYSDHKPLYIALN